MGIKQVATAPYTASPNGTIEGFHRYFAQQLSTRVNSRHPNWDDPEVLDAALFAYRTAPIDGMTVTPYEVLFGREPTKRELCGGADSQLMDGLLREGCCP